MRPLRIRFRDASRQATLADVNDRIEGSTVGVGEPFESENAELGSLGRSSVALTTVSVANADLVGAGRASSALSGLDAVTLQLARR